jgi:hypothetical protein
LGLFGLFKTHEGPLGTPNPYSFAVYVYSYLLFTYSMPAES